MRASDLNAEQFRDLLLEALQAELGAIAVYDAAVRSAMQAELSSEWSECLLQAASRRDDLLRALLDAGVDPAHSSPARQLVAQVSNALVQSIETEFEQGRRDQAQDIALECARLMKRRDRIDWELLAMAADVESGIESEAGTFDSPAPRLEPVTQYVSAAPRARASNESSVVAA